jgi:hypothetical protein
LRVNEVPEDGGSVGIRGPELGVALVLAACGVLVIVDSIRVGIGWADDGPRSGYFPFYIGIGLLASSSWIALQQLLAWGRTHGEFAERAQLGLVWAIFWPMVVYVGLVEWLGIYVGSLVLIGFFMRRHGKHGWATTAAVSVGVPLACFATFERWFLVQLPKGPLEAMLGL